MRGPADPRVWVCALAAAAAAAAPAGAQGLGAADVRAMVERAAGEAGRRGLRATIAVVDREGAPLAVFRMSGAPPLSVVEGQPARPATAGCGAQGLEGLSLPAELVAITKAGTGAFLSTSGHAFSSRTAGFVGQQHFPPVFARTVAGPFYGLQFGSFSCSDVARPGLPLGLALEAGGLPLYRDGRVVGGIGVEGDGRYGAATTNALVAEEVAEEIAAMAGASGFDPPAELRAENIVVDGIRLPYVNAPAVAAGAAAADGEHLVAPRAAPPSRLAPSEAAGRAGFVLPELATRGGTVLTAAEAAAILGRALSQSSRTRSALRRPLNSAARVTVAVVDVDGTVLALFHTEDAPFFSFDAAVQKARTAALFSSAAGGQQIRAAGLAAFAGEVPLDGSVAYTTRAVGFLAQPYLPPGIDGTDPGPFSVAAPPVWSAFHTGLQADLSCPAFEAAASGAIANACTAVPGLRNGLGVSPGGVPLYKDGRLAGAVGVSGDGPDQDDLIAAAGAAGFEPPAERRSDRLVVRGVRVPYQKFPRHPEL